MTSRSDVELARALERGEAPAGGFPHAAHLRVAWVYLSESPSVDAAIARMAASLQRVAASVGKAEKYSQATTDFWMHQVAAVRAIMPDADFDAGVRAFPRLLDKDLIRACTSHDRAAPGAAAPPGDAPDRSVSCRPA